MKAAEGGGEHSAERGRDDTGVMTSPVAGLSTCMRCRGDKETST